MADAAQPMGDPNAIGINWTLFSGVFAAIDTPTRNAVQAIDASLAGVVAPLIRDALTLYLLIMIVAALFSAEGGNILGQVMKQALRGAFIGMLLSNAGLFNEHVAQPLLVDFPNELIQGVVANLGGGTVTNGGGPFDDVWNHAFAAGLVVYKNLPSLSVKGFMLTLCVLTFWLVSLATVSIGFIIFLACHVIQSLMVAVAPLAAGCAMVPVTRPWFAGWYNTVAGVLVAQVLVTGLMSLMILVQTTELARIAAQPAGANEVGQVAALLGVAGIIFICAIIAKMIPNFAMAIAGGAYVHTQAFVSAAGSTMQAGATAAAAALRAATFGPHGLWGGTSPAVSGFQRANPHFAGAALGGHYAP
jgi:type IV secretory pathway VirB6-like protein